MNKRILISLSVIGIVAVIAIGGTIAYFSDVEKSKGNTLSAGSIDLKIDLQCENGVCGFPLRDLTPDYPHFFSACDIKPGDSGEVTISWHVYNNNAWGKIKLADVYDWEYGCTDSEIREAGDTTCDTPGLGLGELSQYLKFTLWMDEGGVAGWQCPGNKPCQADLQEGDNKLNGIEQVFAVKTAKELLDGVTLPVELQGSTTYYLGMKWEVPSDENDDIIQSDSMSATIIMQVVQSKNNPTWSLETHLTFDGVDDYVDVPGIANNPTQITQMAWVKTTYPSNNPWGWNMIMTKRHVDDGSDWATLTLYNGYAVLQVDDSYYVRPIIHGPAVVSDGNWHHIVGVKDGCNYKVYVDGQLDSSYTDCHQMDGSPYNLHIGHHGAWGAYFKGEMDGIRVYYRALSASEILDIYKAGR